MDCHTGIRWAPHGQLERPSSIAPKKQMVSSELILDVEKHKRITEKYQREKALGLLPCYSAEEQVEDS